MQALQKLTAEKVTLLAQTYEAPLKTLLPPACVSVRIHKIITERLSRFVLLFITKAYLHIVHYVTTYTLDEVSELGIFMPHLLPAKASEFLHYACISGVFYGRCQMHQLRYGVGL